MHNPPGADRPACASAARFAAFGPTRSASTAAAAVSGTMNSVMRGRRSFHMVGVAGDRIDHGDLLDWEVRDDLDLLLVHDQHFLDAHAVPEALAVLGLERKGHSGLDLDRMVERPDARDHRRVVLREAEAVAPQIRGRL